MIKINLLDYRRVTQEIAVQKMVVTSLAVIGAALVLTGVLYLMDLSRVESLTEENRNFEKKVDLLKGQYQQVKELKDQKDQISAVIKGIAGLRENKMPVTRLMEDISDNLPQGLWLDGIKKQMEDDLKKDKVPVLFLNLYQEDKKKKKRGRKKKKDEPEEVPHEFMRISGKSRSERSVVRFMERLENLDYLDHVIMHESKLVWIGFEPVRNFVVYAHLTGSGTPPTEEGGAKKKK